MKGPRVHILQPYLEYRTWLVRLHECFPDQGRVVQRGRNLVKVMHMESPGNQTLEVAVKSFKKPAPAAGFIYSHIRLSKARRSLDYAQRLSTLGIPTPSPVACIEYGCSRLLHSYYISRYWQHDYDLFNVLYGKASPAGGIDVLLEQLARFTLLQHQKGVFHMDYNPGNVLTRGRDGGYDFALIDLNRVRFRNPDMPQRLSGLLRLTTNMEFLQTLGHHYALEQGVNPGRFCQRLERARRRFHHRNRILHKLKSLFRT